MILYFILGCLFNRMRGFEGKDMVPHGAFWADLPELIMVYNTSLFSYFQKFLVKFFCPWCVLFSFTVETYVIKRQLLEKAFYNNLLFFFYLSQDGFLFTMATITCKHEDRFAKEYDPVA